MELLDNPIFIERSRILTSELLEAGLSLNITSQMVKLYTKLYWESIKENGLIWTNENLTLSHFKQAYLENQAAVSADDTF